jgi:hypothetical protein
MLKIVLHPPPIFSFSEIEDFGAYIITYIRVLVPSGAYHL